MALQSRRDFGSFPRMQTSDPSDVLYQRVTSHGPEVRIRVTSAAGEHPVTAVLEVDRRAGTPRAGHGALPLLAQCEAPSERDALSTLEPQARFDRIIALLMHEKGLR